MLLCLCKIRRQRPAAAVVVADLQHTLLYGNIIIMIINGSKGCNDDNIRWQ